MKPPSPFLSSIPISSSFASGDREINNPPLVCGSGNNLKASATGVPFSNFTFSLSGILLVSSLEEIGGKVTITPHISDNIARLSDGFFVFFETYSQLGIDSADFVFEVHYAPGSLGEQANVNMRLDYKEAPFIREVYHSPLLFHGWPSLQEPELFIPANTIQTFHEISVEAPVNLSLISVFPHMHLLGKTFKVYGLTPDEDTVRVIDVDHYDFHWQFSYTFPTLTLLPQGSRLYGEAMYDNTDANDDNPNNPPADVGLGENTTDEMMVCFFMYTVHFPGDEDISLVHVNNPPAAMPESLFVYPNPALDLVIVDIPNTIHNVSQVVLINQQGQIIEPKFDFGNGRMTIDTKNLTPGVYDVQVHSSKQIMTTRFVKL